MDSYRDQVMVVFAGYPEPMTKMLDSNPGLRSRAARRYTFTDYSNAELKAIFLHMCQAEEYEVTTAALKKVEQALKDLPRGTNFGNARAARNLFEIWTENMKVRVVAEGKGNAQKADKAALTKLLPEDIFVPASVVVET